MAKKMTTSGRESEPLRSERLSAVERDVAHLDSQLTSLSRRVEQGFEDLQRALANQRQPITAFAGWASVILALVFAFGSPLMSTDARHRDRLDNLEVRERADAFSRGVAEQTFKTLEEKIDAAINNRKDIDAKHVARQHEIESRLSSLKDELSHTLDNGLGRRIDEKIGPIVERIIALERATLQPRADRDIDRK